MKKVVICLIAGLLPFILFVSNAGADCEIPCGIYDDVLRAKLIVEPAGTIEKSMKPIMSLNKDPANSIQLIRWVPNKEAQATEIQHIVSHDSNFPAFHHSNLLIRRCVDERVG